MGTRSSAQRAGTISAVTGLVALLIAAVGVLGNCAGAERGVASAAGRRPVVGRIGARLRLQRGPGHRHRFPAARLAAGHGHAERGVGGRATVAAGPRRSHGSSSTNSSAGHDCRGVHADVQVGARRPRALARCRRRRGRDRGALHGGRMALGLYRDAAATTRLTKRPGLSWRCSRGLYSAQLVLAGPSSPTPMRRARRRSRQRTGRPTLAAWPRARNRLEFSEGSMDDTDQDIDIAGTEADEEF